MTSTAIRIKHNASSERWPPPAHPPAAAAAADTPARPGCTIRLPDIQATPTNPHSTTRALSAHREVGKIASLLCVVALVARDEHRLAGHLAVQASRVLQDPAQPQHALGARILVAAWPVGRETERLSTYYADVLHPRG